MDSSKRQDGAAYELKKTNAAHPLVVTRTSK